MVHQSARQAFTAALDTLVGQVRQDRSILAALLCGSLSHDTVWAKSDIDLVLVTIDDSKVPAGDKSLYADGVNVHALLVPRAEFRKMAEGSARNSFAHSAGRMPSRRTELHQAIERACARGYPIVIEGDAWVTTPRAAAFYFLRAQQAYKVFAAAVMEKYIGHMAPPAEA